MSRKKEDALPVAAKSPAGLPAAYDPEMLGALVATDDFQGMSRADAAVPFLVVLQSLSPQCVQGNPEYNESARPGMISHSITKELFREVWVTPVAYKRSYVEWVPRTAGGGFRGEYEAATHEEVFNRLRNPETGKARLENGNDLVETLNFYCILNHEDGATEPVIISMSSTQTKAARIWNQMQQNYSPPGAPRRQYKRYIAKYLLTTELRRKDQNTWFVWKIGRAEMNEQPALIAGNALENSIRANTLLIDRSQLEPEHASETADATTM